MSKKTLSAGFKEALAKLTPETAINFAKSVVESYSGLEAEYNGVQDQLSTAATLIEEQSAQLEKAKTDNPNYRPVSEIKGKSYRINHPIRHEKRGLVSIDDIQKDLKLVEELIKGGSTAVSLLSNEELENL